MIRFLFGIILGLAILPGALWFWCRKGSPPVAVSDTPFPMERTFTHTVLQARIDREIQQNPPVQPTEENLVAGAVVYRDQCAVCHGFHGHAFTIGGHMFPQAPALWEKHHNTTVVGVSDDPVGETFWKVANGIRLTGMPSFTQVLNATQMWQVSTLLANADKPLPAAAVAILHGQPPSVPAVPQADKPPSPPSKP